MCIRDREEGVKYNPDIVVLGFVFDDIYRNILTFRDYAKPMYKIVNDGIELTNLPVPPPEEMLKREAYKSKFIDLLNIAYQRIRWKKGLNEKYAEKVTELIFDEMANNIKKAGAMPLFVYLPIGNEITSNDFILRGERHLSEYCIKNDIDFLSIRPYFKKAAENGLALKTSGHYDASQHKIAAQAILDYMTGHDMVPNRR